MADLNALVDSSKVERLDNQVDIRQQTKAQLETQLADARLLHQLSIELIQEDGTAGLYKKIVEAAVKIMRSDYASMQMLYPDDGTIGKLRLLASAGFSPEAEKFWEWVYRHTGSSCGAALRAQERAIITNFATDEYMKTAPTLPVFLEAGIYAAQSTPLYSRNGTLLGMISTHWNHPHTPSDKQLELLDLLARQAADLIERTKTAEALKESEEQLRKLTAHLEDKVEERTRELQRSNEDLQQFAHVASHDLKEPVRKIKTFGLRLQKELNVIGNDDSKLYLEKMMESASRMSTMIEGVLTFASFDSLDQRFEAVNLNDIIRDIKTDLEVLIQQKNAEINFGELPNVSGIPVLIHQLFYNLINNSLKFSKEDLSPQIKITSRLERGSVVISIADNGIGFDPEHNQSVFNTFTRLHPKQKYDGTGLGLALAKKIVERHMGTIKAHGIKSVGATFVITFPL